VSFAVPDSSVIVQGLTLLVDYPEARVTIPGSGNATSVRQTIINVQSGALSQPFDLDYALREQIAGTAHPLTPGQLFTINFLDCQGATPPTAADFTCTVEVATDPLGLPDQGGHPAQPSHHTNVTRTQPDRVMVSGECGPSAREGDGVCVAVPCWSCCRSPSSWSSQGPDARRSPSRCRVRAGATS
jgi:hypothetical protein